MPTMSTVDKDEAVDANTHKVHSEQVVNTSEQETVKANIITPDEPTASTIEEEWEDHLPLLKYSKLSPESSSTLTCTAAAQVLLDPAEALDLPTDEESVALLKSDLWKQPHFLLAMGWEAGTISLWSVSNSLPIQFDDEPSDTHPLYIREGASWTRSSPPTMDVSMDSTGTLLAAIDQEGVCCIWEFKYSPSWQRQQVPIVCQTPPTPHSPTHGRKVGMFSSFMTALTGLPPTPENEVGLSSTITHTANTATRTVTVPCLAASIVSTSRITYPVHWKSPTCMVLDPAHKKKSTKSLVVGFKDGRLLLTKRGGLFQRRNDTILFQGGSDSTSYEGIECVTWRGNLVAWADASGIKLLDIESLTRIAHIDRPTGARASLYPTLTQIRPHLIFETTSNLLVVWGDCLMSMAVQETPAPGDGTSITMRRTVQCSMAWELDCVAAGVAPLDADHIVVLGIVVPTDEDNDENDADGVQQGINELEVQIVSRHDGTIQYADVLPNSVDAPLWLESSFALARMDNASEWNEYKTWSGRVASDMFDLTLLTGVGGGSTIEASPSNTTSEPTLDGDSSRVNNPVATTGFNAKLRNTFVDSHLQWNMKAITFAGNSMDTPNNDDQNSVDSDDYGFVLRPLELVDDTTDSFDFLASPPVMVLASQSELILTALSSVDDAVEHALVTQNRPALALKRALQHRRQLRRYKVSDLVQHYLEAVLHLCKEVTEPLSLRRMKLAIQAMPVLLGGDVNLWTKWANELKKLPGALFILQSYLPVRDPVLPISLYEQVLLGMLQEYQQLILATRQAQEESISSFPLDREAGNHVLQSLLAWGPTKGLKEYIKLFQYSRRNGDTSVIEALKGAEIALQRRYLQTAAGYLSFPATKSSDDQVGNNVTPTYDANSDDSQDSLFPLNSVMKWMAQQVESTDRATELGEESETAEFQLSIPPNDLLCLDVMARLRVLQCRYDLALHAYLQIGAYHSSVSLDELESLATDMVQLGSSSEWSQPIRIGNTSYEYVVGLIENHHLHRLLLDPSFLSKDSNGTSKGSKPLIAILRLVGLQRVGEFLIEHCVAPESPTYAASGFLSSEDNSKDDQHSETLPLDLVAAQLESCPALLHWYLHMVFLRKPELYVKFPNNSLPQDAITELHRKHFQLYLRYAGDEKDSSAALSTIEIYKVEALTTPLLSFLRVSLSARGNVES